MADQPAWQVLSSDIVFDHAPWLRVERQAVQLPNGVHIPDYVLAHGRDFSLVVAVTDAREVLVIQHYKHGLGRVVLDFPAGYLDTPAEDPLACAQRELREETGYAAAHWTALGAWAIDSNRNANVAHLFFARGLRRMAEPSLEATEALTTLALPVHQVSERLRAGDLPTLACAAAWGLAAAYLSN